VVWCVCVFMCGALVRNKKKPEISWPTRHTHTHTHTHTHLTS